MGTRYIVEVTCSRCGIAEDYDMLIWDSRAWSCQACGNSITVSHKEMPPERIYLQYYDEDGNCLDPANNEVTWCVDQVNDNDPMYVLVARDDNGN